MKKERRMTYIKALQPVHVSWGQAHALYIICILHIINHLLNLRADNSYCGKILGHPTERRAFFLNCLYFRYVGLDAELHSPH